MAAVQRDNRRDIHSALGYLARDPLYQTEKPYAAVDFVPPFKPTNHTFETVPLTVHDARSIKNSFKLEQHGFCFIDVPTAATFEGLKVKGPAVDEYHSEIEGAIRRHFPEYTKVNVIDWWLRRRDPGFPDQDGMAEDSQPARLPHTDFSVDGLHMRMGQVCPGQDQFYVGKDFDLINVWRVLRGPNNDWPLAVCDYSTVDADDALANDFLTINSVGENRLLRANPKHQWYYLSDQTVDEMIVFRNIDSKGQRPHAFHAAFDAKSKQDFCRSSVEVRVVAFR